MKEVVVVIKCNIRVSTHTHLLTPPCKEEEKLQCIFTIRLLLIEESRFLSDVSSLVHIDLRSYATVLYMSVSYLMVQNRCGTCVDACQTILYYCSDQCLIIGYTIWSWGCYVDDTIMIQKIFSSNLRKYLFIIRDLTLTACVSCLHKLKSLFLFLTQITRPQVHRSLSCWNCKYQVTCIPLVSTVTIKCQHQLLCNH